MNFIQWIIDKGQLTIKCLSLDNCQLSILHCQLFNDYLERFAVNRYHCDTSRYSDCFVV